MALHCIAKAKGPITRETHLLNTEVQIILPQRRQTATIRTLEQIIRASQHLHETSDELIVQIGGIHIRFERIPQSFDETSGGSGSDAAEIVG